MPMLIGYARVSRTHGSQAPDLQKDDLVQEGVSPRHIYEDQASDKNSERSELDACMKAFLIFSPRGWVERCL